MRLMEMADRFDLPVLCLVDTGGRFPASTPKRRNQAERRLCPLDRRLPGAGRSLMSRSCWRGGSGGAVAIASCKPRAHARARNPIARSLRLESGAVVGPGIHEVASPEAMGGAHGDDPSGAAIQPALEAAGMSRDQLRSARAENSWRWAGGSSRNGG